MRVVGQTGIVSLRDGTVVPESTADADGDALSYTWAFDGDTVREGRRANHRFGSKGTYRVFLTVTDGQETTTVRMLVEVKKAKKGKKGKRKRG